VCNCQPSPSVTIAELDRIPYLHAIAQEANRLSFGLTGRHPRIAPDETLQYVNPSTKTAYAIPPGTPMSTSTLLAHTDDEIFPDPWKFDPDRWLDSERIRRKKYSLAFGKGPSQCVGMHMANMELLSTIAEMAKWDMKLFETTEG
jgi:cytochrome P450